MFRSIKSLNQKKNWKLESEVLFYLNYEIYHDKMLKKWKFL